MDPVGLQTRPWPPDPTPGEMAYICVCPKCAGVSLLCATLRLRDHLGALTRSLQHGDDLYRVPASAITIPLWHFCHCDSTEVPHG